MKIHFFLLTVLLWTVGARALFAQNQTESPYFYVPDKNTNLESFPLLQTEVEANIAGVIADVQIAQYYQNTGKEAIEAVYIFPASTNAAVYGMQMTIGERRIKAKIKEKEKARKMYEQARTAGKSASLLEQHRPNVFQMNVANIMPGDTIKVELFYTELLVPEDGVYQFVYPTVVGPRYTRPGEAKSQPVAQNWTANPYLQENKPPNYLFGLSLNIRAGLPVKGIQCNSHDVNVNYSAKDQAQICLKSTERQSGNRDFILQYRLKGQEIENGLLLYEGEKENFFLMMMQPPERPKVREIPAREYIFIVDISGSMRGFPLDVSKGMMRELLSELSPKDVFNVLLFAGSADFLSPQSLTATKENITAAMQVIDRRQGGGGTHMLGAIHKAMQTPKKQGFARSFVILTDGFISFEASIFNYIRDNLNQANFFAFGIGSSVNRHLIEGIAHAGFSDPFVVTNPAEAPVMGKQFRKYIQTPVLTNIEVDFKGLDVYDLAPARLPDLMGERPVIVFGKYRGKAKGALAVSGENAAGKFNKPLAFSSEAAKVENKALRYLWARHRLKTLSDYAGSAHNNADLKGEITNIGLQYNLLTPYTSFVAIEEIVRNKTGKINSVKQPLPLPKGVENSAIGAPPPVIEEVPEEESLNFHDRSTGTNLEIEAPRTAEPPPPPPPPSPMVEEVFRVAESMPRFPGCEEATSSRDDKKACADKKMLDFVYGNLQYPAIAKENGISGTVVVQFTVEKDGSIQDIKIVRDIGGGCGQEALRIIQKMIDDGLKWIPGKHRGRPVKVLYNLPIRFRLE